MISSFVEMNGSSTTSVRPPDQVSRRLLYGTSVPATSMLAQGVRIYVAVSPRPAVDPPNGSDAQLRGRGLRAEVYA
jgi:hypothetical protein